MPLVTLSNNKIVEIPLDIYLGGDKEYELYIQELMALNAGTEIDDPMFGFSMEEKMLLDTDLEEEIDDSLDNDLLLRDDI